MQRNLIVLASVSLFIVLPVVNGKQRPSAQPAPQTKEPTSGNAVFDCAADSDTLRQTSTIAAPAPPAAEAYFKPDGSAEAVSTDYAAVNLERDLNFLVQTQSELANCNVTGDAQEFDRDSREVCVSELLLNFEMRHDGEPERDIPIGRLPGSAAFFYESGMTIDADGAPNAYHPDNSGLDDLENAGAPGNWQGLAKDANGEPFIQGPDDPFPGYYVSATALADHSKAVNDPARYVDASKIPFVVLPGGMARQIGARPGDFAAVFNQRNGKSSYAIFGDVGPHDRIGEGSVALAENLGIRSNARNGGAHRGIFYLLFPGSGNGHPRTIEEINSEGQKLLQAWEVSLAQSACIDRPPTRTQEGN
jgi:hypothetical protein